MRSFVKYIRRLNPGCPFLFQQSRKEPKENIYYSNFVIGHNRLGSMMSVISEAASLSQRYTNHSLRATKVHILEDSTQIPSRHIMSVTEHKSESSLKTYSGKTTENTKKICQLYSAQDLVQYLIQLRHLLQELHKILTVKLCQCPCRCVILPTKSLCLYLLL